VQDCHVGYVEALCGLGELVVEFPLGDLLSFYDHAHVPVGGEFRKALSGEQATQLATDRLAGALYKVRPDALFLTSGFFLDARLLDVARRDGVKVVALLTEQPYEHSRELALASHCDVALLTDPINLVDFREVCTAVHAPHCYRPTVHTPGPAVAELAADFAFVGTGYPSRVAFLEAMDLTDLDVLLAGNWQQLDDTSPLRGHVATGLDECVDNTAAVDIYRSAAVGMNLYRRESERPELSAGWAVGPREIEMAAIGAFFLRDPRPEGDELFPMLPVFHSPEEASEQLRWWLNRPDQRAEAAMKAREAVAHRTFDTNAAALLRLLERK
jgi:hypothetical protein